MNQTALLIIDVQKGLDDPSLGERNNPEAESNMARLLAAWRGKGLPVIYIRHCSVEADSPLRPERPGNAFKDEVQPQPGETEFTKTTNSAFVGTRLQEHLGKHAISELVIIGLTTDHCVSASARNASDLGYDVTVVSDATAAHGRVGYDGVAYTSEMIHRVSLVTLDGEFGTVRSTDEVLELID